ncbi:AraC family transcriptional regulator [Sinomicrobium weinanense]|uniref:AraC family transcriptional regulator n=1 Tax=Sinomicrobium weinanense TaxID=2842200 RepID=A0A926JUR3_9FLAO|nr:AraC family transcriptional regulator [Sinomicrobium weinanense]MBC9797598.1 AraC family transcriptional regulator [Sinomicrobium weinanense]MBU3123665.1 AraC family transcriptional regulator [Sinomicrobium weinanense]
MIYKQILVISFFATHVVFPQVTPPTRITNDSLRKEDYRSLYDHITSSKNDSITQSLYLKAYLNKAQMESNREKMIQGYKHYLHYSHGNLKLIYGDSMILMAKKTDDPILLGSAYLSVGGEYYNLKRYKEALDHYLESDRYLVKTDDNYLKYKLKYNMALVKYYTRYYDEAISLLTECLEYFKTEAPRGYLNTLHFLSRCHSSMENYGSSSRVNQLGITEGRKIGNTSMEVYFIQSEGINDCIRSDYHLAIHKLDSTLKVIREEKDDFANEVLGLFYLGKSYWGLDERKKAVEYFKAVDTCFKTRGYMKREYLEGYKLLDAYHKSRGELKLQLHYLGRQLQAMEFLDTQEKYLDDKVKNEYDVKRVRREKEKVEALLQTRNKQKTWGIIAGIFLFILILSLVYRSYRIKKIYKQRFEAFMKGHRPQNQATKKKRPPSQKPDISQKVIDMVLKKLDTFEKGKKFLDKKMSVSKFAATLEVNNKYLSQIISHFKKKGVTEYLNDLRIDYIVDRM